MYVLHKCQDVVSLTIWCSIVSIIMWLCRSVQYVGTHTHMIEDIAVRVRHLCFAAAQTEQWVFSLPSVTQHVHRVHAGKDCLGQAKEPHTLASSLHKLEQHGMEAKFEDE